MAFSQEIRFKIGGDTSSLKRSFSEAEGIAEKAGRRMENMSRGALSARKQLVAFQRKTDFDQLDTLGKIKVTEDTIAKLTERRSKLAQNSTKFFQTQLSIEKQRAQLTRLNAQQAGESATGAPATPSSNWGMIIARVVGAGITYALTRVIAWNQSRVQVAQAQESSGAASLQSLRSRFAAVGGMESQLRQGRGTVKDLESQRDFEQKRAEMLSTGTQGAVSAISPEELTKSEVEIAKINAQIQAQHGANQLIEKDIAHANYELDDQLRLLEKINYSRGAGQANELRLAIMEQNRLVGLYEQDKIAKRVLDGTVQDKERLLEIAKQETAIIALHNAMLSKQADIRQGLTQDAAGGRTFRNGAPRPRSETERLAQRPGMFRNRARDLILQGSTGGGAGVAIAAARRDEASVATRLGAASESVGAPPGATDFSALRGEIANSNLILKAIESALTRVDVN